MMNILVLQIKADIIAFWHFIKNIFLIQEVKMN